MAGQNGFNVEKFAETYKAQDIDRLSKDYSKYFGEMTVYQWGAALESAEDEVDPVEKYKQLSQLWQQVMQTGAFMAGIQKLGPQLDQIDMGKQEKLGLIVNTGASLVDKVLKGGK